MNRYSAKLLFQLKVTVGGSYGKRRLCEEAIILFKADSASQALALAKQKGRDWQYSSTHSDNALRMKPRPPAQVLAAHWDSTLTDGAMVEFEFIGVMELLELGLECEEDEVWYEIKERLEPMERADKFIPPEHLLNAIRNESPVEQTGRKLKKRN